MAYADATDLVTTYGLGEITELLADEEGLLTPALVKDVIEGQPLSGYPADAQAAATAALARLEALLERQTQYIDSKLAVRYALPLPAPAQQNTPVVECCLALARAALADDGDNLSATMKEERQHWRDWLAEVVASQAHIVGATPLTP